MKSKILIFCLIVFAFNVFADGINENESRAKDIENEMWVNCKDYFHATEIPEKWSEEPAVIIARDIRTAYKKDLIISNLRYNYYSHQRVKLLSKASVEHYSAFSIPGSRGGSNIYAGFKIIKPNGEEKTVSLEHMAREVAKYNNYKMDIFKLAIPDLEIGDILDYYMAEERVTNIYGIKFYSFDPMILELNAEYPIVKQQFAFDVLRRCYVNMKSLNGAPKFTLSMDEEDEDVNRYILVDEDRERVDDLIWFFPYREVPTIKFKVTYASAFAAEYSSFLGAAGDLRTSISEKDLGSYIKQVFTIAPPSELKRLMKKNYSQLTDKVDIARTSYYLLRYLMYVKGAENYYLNGYYENKGRNFVRELSAYYRQRGINHSILIGIPRQISGIDDLILENELTFALKIEHGGQVYYISNFDKHSYFGEIDNTLQGTMVYSTHSLRYPVVFEKEKVPVVEPTENTVTINYRYSIADLDQGTMTLRSHKSASGDSRREYQAYLLDFYSFKQEERQLHPYHNEFEGVTNRVKAELKSKQHEILGSREREFEEKLKKALENDLSDVDVTEVRNFRVLQTGRFNDQKNFEYEFEADLKGPLRKVGPNYLLEIGKLIDGQVEIPEDQIVRKYNIYMNFARSYAYTLEIAIPEGYEVRGIENLRMEKANSTGEFRSEAEIKGDKLIVKTSKIYRHNYEPVENWALMLEFIQQSNQFENSQVLFRKIN